MPSINGPYEPCKGRLILDGANILHVTRMGRRRRLATRRITTTDTDCEAVPISGRKEGDLSFSVVLSDDQDIHDVLDIGDEGTLQYIYDRSKGAAGKGFSHEVKIIEISDDIDMEGEVELINITAQDTAVPVRIS